MTEHDHAVELSTNATLAAGLALVAVAAIGGGGLIAATDGAQIGYYLSDSGGGVATGGVGGGVLGTLGGGVAGFHAAFGGSTMTAAVVNGLGGSAIGGPIGAVVGASAGAL